MTRSLTQPGPPRRELLTTAEFAAEIIYHPESVRRCIREGRIRAVLVGRTWRVPRSELERITATGLSLEPVDSAGEAQ